MSQRTEIQKSNILFVALTLRDVRFYIEVAKEIARRFPSTKVQLLSVFQPGNKLIDGSGVPYLDFYQYLDKVPGPENLTKIFSDFKIDNPQPLLLHEKVTFGIRDEERLQRKLAKYLLATETIFKELIAQDQASQWIVFQELGGFFVNLAVFLNSKRFKIDHYFFEPAFFKGRLCAVKDSTTSLLLDNPQDQETISEAWQYLQNLRKERTVVVPQKDRHHFMDMGIKKVFNSSNIKKLVSKISDRYVHKYKFEFSHTANHVRRTLQMFLNRKVRSPLYEPLEKLPQNYVYFPLHVELDCSLTIRSPKYFDQIGLLREIEKLLPESTHLVAKEHPASIGGFDQLKLKKLIEDCPKFHLMHPSINSYDLLEKASAVVTINSKVGAEAIAFQKPVLVLGDAFYAKWKVATFCNNLEELAEKLSQIDKLTAASDAQLQSCFSQAWSNSFEGELYVETKDNLEKFVAGISPSFY